MNEYLLLVLVVFGVNLLPAFGPPSWALLVFFSLRYDIPTVPLVLLGALAAACGRVVLALGARRMRGHLSAKRIADLDALQTVAQGNRRAAVGGLLLFAISPVPSAQLFVAAGLTGVPLVPLTTVFFAGRLVSYTIYATAAKAAEKSIETIISEGFTSPKGIALQVLMLALLVVMIFAPWKRLLARYLQPKVPEEADSVEATPMVSDSAGSLNPDEGDDRSKRADRPPEAVP